MTYRPLKRLFRSQHIKAFLIILLVLILAYAIPEITSRSQNPILQRAGLSAEIQPGYVLGQNTIDPNDGFTSQALGHTAAQSWLAGKVPYWNHYEGLGAPLAGEGQSAALFPLTILQHFANGLVYSHFLLELLAGMAAYLFFRKLRVKFGIAVLGGVLFSLNGAFAWLTNAPFNAVAFLPLMLLGVEYAIERVELDTKERGGWWLLAVALALSLYSGFPEGAFINAIFAYGWAAVRFFYINKKSRKAYILKILLGSIIGLMLAGPILISFLGYLPYGLTGGHQSGGYANVSLPIKTLPALFMPYIFGPIFGYVASGQPTDLFMFWSNVGGYLTMPLLFMALVGLYAKRPLGLKLYPAIFAAVVFLKVYGFKPAALLVNVIPGMDQVAFYRYSIPALSFAVVMLAVFGLEAIVKSEIRKKKIIKLATLVLIFIVGLTLFAKQLLHKLAAYPSHRLWAIFSVVWALTALLIPIFVFLKPRIKVLGIMSLLAADSLLMFVIPQFSLPKMSAIDYRPVQYLQQNLGFERFYTLHPIEPNYGSYFGIASINVNDLPVPKNWATYISQKLDSNVNPILFTGYSSTNPAGPTALEEFGRNFTNYEQVGVKYLVTDHGQVSVAFASQYGLKESFSDPKVDIWELPAPEPYYQSIASCTFTYQNLDSVTTNCPTATTLVRHELYIPGWSANVNSTPEKVKPAQNVFQQIKLPVGQATIKFSYNPPYIKLGYVALGIGVLAILPQAINPKSKDVQRLKSYFRRRTTKLK